MRFVHVRRHSSTKKGDSQGRGSDLSQGGVELARRVGSELPRYDLVVGSRARRTLETALALGVAVEDEVSYPDVTDGTGIDFQAWWDWDEPFVDLARIMDENERAARAGAAIADAWAGVARSVSDGGRALVVSHGGIMELGLVAALPDAERKGWGSPFSQCEGFGLTFEQDGFADVEFFRL